jgi:hypothetical protein
MYYVNSTSKITFVLNISDSFKIDGFNFHANIDLDIVQSPLRIYILHFHFCLFALSVICRFYILRSPVKFLFCLVPTIVFSFRANPFFFVLGQYAAEHGMV